MCVWCASVYVGLYMCHCMCEDANVQTCEAQRLVHVGYLPQSLSSR